MALTDTPKRILTRLAARAAGMTLGANSRVVLPYAPSRGAADWAAVPAGDRTGEPVPPWHLRVGYGRTDEEYLESGRAHVATMVELLTAHGHPPAHGARVLDFGCAAGRMTRFVRDHHPGAEVWGVDIDAGSIAWASRHLAHRAAFATTTQYPHLPFEDNYFDLIFAGSVFSHVDDLATAWFLELRRITRPDGVLFLTVQDETTIRVVLDQAFEDHWLQRFRFPAHAERAARALLRKEIVSFSYNRGEYPHVYHDSAELVASLEGHFTRVALRERAYGYQSALILTK
jgi:ubiquinone/menaquinone biosynthesis C-methylase UbiE